MCNVHIQYLPNFQENQGGGGGIHPFLPVWKKRGPERVWSKFSNFKAFLLVGNQIVGLYKLNITKNRKLEK